MTDEEVETLKRLFDFDPRHRSFNIRFDDEEEFELEAMNWWHDKDEPAHGTGIVIKRFSQRDHGNKEMQSASRLKK